MLLNRHRGLANLHITFTLLIVLSFFWVYAEITIRWLSDFMRLTRDVNLLPYVASVAIGMALGSRRVFLTGERLLRAGWAEAASLAAQQTGIIALVVFTMMFATQDRSISRLFLGTSLVLIWLLLSSLHRFWPRRFAAWFYGHSQAIPTLIVGRATRAPQTADWLGRRTELGLKIVGFVGFETNDEDTRVPFSWLGTVADLPQILSDSAIGQVILMELPALAGQGKRIIEQCQAHGCRLLIHDNVEERLDHPVISVEEGGHHFLTLHDEPLEEPLNRAFKRLFDLVVSLPVVALLLPVICLVVWLVQRAQSPGPLFHIRPRVSGQRARFSMLKFRTMHVATPDEKAEGKQATADDQRIYPFGRFLRRHSLDEFPQFWNVLRGDMSIVGPRPVMPLLDEEFERQARSYRTRHFVKPGITGLAQSEGFRGEIKTPEQLHERVRLDLYYISHWSFWLDVQITAKTLWQVFVPPKSAY